jgi:hypothetical protein
MNSAATIRSTSSSAKIGNGIEVLGIACSSVRDWTLTRDGSTSPSSHRRETSVLAAMEQRPLPDGNTVRTSTALEALLLERCEREVS